MNAAIQEARNVHDSNGTSKQNEEPQRRLENETFQIETVFEKRSGTTDRGKDYEHFFIANVILELLRNDNVQDFYLSSNNKDFGAFDDIVIEIKHHDKWTTYAIQLKHKDNAKIQEKDLNSQNKKNIFAIKKYFDDYSESTLLKRAGIKMILFTNVEADFKKGKEIELNFGQQPFNVISVSDFSEFLVASRETCYKFLPKNNEHADFFDNFFLYTKQPKVDTLKQHALNKFKEMFNSDKSSFDEYMSFIETWSISSKKKKEKLNKSWLMEVITVNVLSLRIKPLSFSLNSSLEENSKTFREAVSKFHMTIFENESEHVVSLWKDALNEIDLKEINQARIKYHIGEYIEKKDLEKGGKEISKILWLLRQCPLIVEGLKTSKQSFFVLNVSLLDNMDCFFKHLANIQVSLIKKEGFSVFQKLSDLEGNSLHEKFLKNFTYSLEGQRPTSLENLRELSEEVGEIFSTDKLAQMMYSPLKIGNLEEELPFCHINRSLLAVNIEWTFLEEFSSDTFVVVSSVPNSEILRTKNKKVRLINQDMNLPEFQQSTIYFTENECPQEDFCKLFESLEKRRGHLFRYLNQQYLQWVMSKGDINDLAKFQHPNSRIEEEDLLNDSSSTNIICANPGMGKTILAKSLKLHGSSSHWTIVVRAGNHAAYFRNKKTDACNVDNFFKHILDTSKFREDFDKKVFQILVENNRVRLIWDGLDEASEETFKKVLKIIGAISAKGIKQFITSRNNLKTELENEFCVLSTNLVPFNIVEQRKYVGQRLRLSPENLDKVFKKIRRNIETFSNNNILEIPLQIYMLTELLSRDEDRYLEELEKMFTVANLYENFVNEKFNVFGKEKLGCDFDNETQNERFEEEKERRIECYKNIAAKTYLGIGSIEGFRESFNKKDPVGIITKISEHENIPEIVKRQVYSKDRQFEAEFSHNSFGEYLAALYLSENYDEYVRNKIHMFDARLSNILFFLYLILAKESKGHVAILCNNCHLLDECTEEDLNRKDAVQRDILESVFSGENNFRLCHLKKNRYETYSLDSPNYSAHYNISFAPFDHQRYTKSSRRIQEAPTDLKKIMLLLPSTISLYNRKRKCFNYTDIPTLIYSSVRNDYSTFMNLFHIPFIEFDNDETLLDVAINSESICCLRFLLEDPRYFNALKFNYKLLLKICRSKLREIFDICCKKGIDINSAVMQNKTFMHYACEKGDSATIAFLFTEGGKDLSDYEGRTLVHCACLNWKNGLQILQVLSSESLKFDVADVKGCTPMHYACELRNYKLTDFLIKSGAKSLPDDEGRTPLHYACENGSIEIIELLISDASMLSVADPEGRKPIHYVCQNANVALVEFLESKGAKLDVTDNNNRTLMHYAAMNSINSLEILRFLIGRDLSVNRPDSYDRLPIHYACDKGDFETVKFLIDNHSESNKLDINNRTPIHFSCEKGDSETVKLLIEKGAKLDAQDTSGLAPLHYACKNFDNNFKIVKMLIGKKVKVNIKDSDGRLPIHYACATGGFGLVKLLVDKGAKFDASDNNNRRPIHYACENGNYKIVELLTGKKSYVDTGSEIGQTLIHSACKRGSKEVVEFLIQEETKLSVADADGRLPLHYACGNGNGVVVKLLLEKEVSFDVRDAGGITPLHYACKEGHFGIVKLLIDKDARLDIVDKEGKTPMDYACEKGHVKIATLICNQNI